MNVVQIQCTRIEFKMPSTSTFRVIAIIIHLVYFVTWNIGKLKAPQWLYFFAHTHTRTTLILLLVRNSPLEHGRHDLHVFTIIPILSPSLQPFAILKQLDFIAECRSSSSLRILFYSFYCFYRTWMRWYFDHLNGITYIHFVLQVNFLGIRTSALHIPLNYHLIE